MCWKGLGDRDPHSTSHSPPKQTLPSSSASDLKSLLAILKQNRRELTLNPDSRDRQESEEIAILEGHASTGTERIRAVG
jgi:hypothetical protein